MRYFPSVLKFGLLLVCLAAIAAAEPSRGVLRAEAEVARIAKLVDSGTLPRKALIEAETALAEAHDQDILATLLFGQLVPEEITEAQTNEMLAAAERSLERQKTKVNDAQRLVTVGAMAQVALAPYLEDLAKRQEVYIEASSRAELLLELSSMVHAEADLDQLAGMFADDGRPIVERFDGEGIFLNAHLKELLLAYEKQFGKPFPVSARGETALHRSLGFDHRGRVDVAVSPDTREGVWLREYLQSMQIPFYAFRGAVKGKSTAAHFHLGPSSTRLKRAD